MNGKIYPVGLKGNQITERMKELMGVTPINENKTSSVVELTKLGPDGKVYAIVRENHEYYIKVSENKKNLTVEDFKYIGGLVNKKQEAYSSYAKATKHLNLKFNSLNEALGKSGNINVLENDNLVKEGGWAGFSSMGGNSPMFKNEGNLQGHDVCECGGQIMEGHCMECGAPYGGGVQEAPIRSDDPHDFKSPSFGMDEFDKPAMDSFKSQYGPEKGVQVYYATANKQDRDPETFEKNEDEMLSPELEAVQDMMDETSPEDYSPKQHKLAGLAGDPDEIDAADFAALRHGRRMHERLSIAKSINDMDDIIENVVDSLKKKAVNK